MFVTYPDTASYTHLTQLVSLEWENSVPSDAVTSLSDFPFVAGAIHLSGHVGLWLLRTSSLQ